MYISKHCRLYGVYRSLIEPVTTYITFRSKQMQHVNVLILYESTRRQLITGHIERESEFLHLSQENFLRSLIPAMATKNAREDRYKFGFVGLSRDRDKTRCSSATTNNSSHFSVSALNTRHGLTYSSSPLQRVTTSHDLTIHSKSAVPPRL